MKDEPIIPLAAKFGPILKAAFPNEHSITRFDVANALAEAAIAEAGKPASSPVGDYEARYVHGGAPTDCVDYGVVSLSKGKEVCRVWERDDAELIARLLNASLSPISGEAVPSDDQREWEAAIDRLGAKVECIAETLHGALNQAIHAGLEHRYFPEPASVAGEADVRHLAAILEEWDHKDPYNGGAGHAYEDIARDALTRLTLSKPTPVEGGLAKLVREYRPTMDKEVLHSWAQDILAALSETQKEGKP